MENLLGRGLVIDGTRAFDWGVGGGVVAPGNLFQLVCSRFYGNLIISKDLYLGQLYTVKKEAV